jgi:hypothetical protein
LLALTLQPADHGDTTTIQQTLEEAQAASRQSHERGVEEVVADKGYHSGAVLQQLHDDAMRSYIPEPERRRRNWQGEGKWIEQKRVYANRRRVRAARSKRLQKLRSELTERTFAHLYECGSRNSHLRVDRRPRSVIAAPMHAAMRLWDSPAPLRDSVSPTWIGSWTNLRHTCTYRRWG